MTGLVCAVGAWVVLLVVGTIWNHVRTRRVAASRPGENFQTFRSSFVPDEAPPEVLAAVYAKFQELCSDAVVAFPVRADDEICRVYGVVNEDLDDAVLEVLAECGRRPPTEEDLCRTRPVLTVRDFACFVAACPRAPSQ